MKKLLIACCTLIGFVCISNGALARDPLPQTIAITVPFPPGSTSDLIPRLIAPEAGKTIGSTIIVENRPGANGSLGAAKVAKSPADGSSLLLATTGVLAINPWIYPKLSYNPEKDFEPVINIASTPNVLVINPKINANNIRELVALSKSSPGTLTYASAGNGSTSHLCGESLKRYSGIDMTHIPYQGPAPAIQDVLGGQVSMICDNFSNVIQYIRSGRLKAIFVASKERHPQATDIPSALDVGLPDVEAGIWYGIVAPAGTPKATVTTLNAEFAKALKDPAIRAKLESLGLKIIADKPQDFAAQIARDSARFQKDVKLSGVSIE
ncbi:Bug family tripartite tricarboxylate transporter substrate binding protein [Polynucleobacter sinensis]|uniref:Bug family tripartite tricarboxylate transporter substrate binding protein n=1 Tax=Polynucleobacter sinensis TaxID=1743157 RepID=UPI000781241F|nr:tripartite tricarboxylate transporter substrate binding protein [Polynucleobacter sinensis]